MSLKVKLAGGFGVLLVIMAVMAFVSYSSINKLSDLSNEVEKQLVKKQFSIELDSGLELQTSSTRGFLLSGREELLKRRDEGVAQFSDRAGELSKLLQTERGKAVMEHIKAEAQEVQSAQGHAIELRRSGKKDEAFKAIFNDHTSQVRADLEKSIDDLIALIQKLQDTAQTEHEQIEVSTVRLVVILACAGLLIGLAVAMLIVRSITGAISRMLGMIQEIAAKNLSVTDLEITSEDEIGKAGRAQRNEEQSTRGNSGDRGNGPSRDQRE